jgi:glycosyltransferase involved in cell wall biosynthesis
MNKIKICHLIQGLDPGEEGVGTGGAERLALELVEALDQTQLEIAVCCLWGRGGAAENDWKKHLQAKGISATILCPKRFDQNRSRVGIFGRIWIAGRRLRSYLRKLSPHILHSHAASPDLLTAFFRPRLTGLRSIRTAQNELEWPDWPLVRKLVIGWFFPWLFEKEIAVSERVLRRLNDRPMARFLNKKAILIYNGINPERMANRRINPAVKKVELGLTKEKPTVGIIGRLVEQKGHFYFLEAILLLVNMKKDIQVLIVGTGPLRESLQQRVLDLGLQERISFLGQRRDVEEILSALDVLVVASLWEGLSLVLLEGMAAGLPIVATRVSGNEEILAAGDCGLLVPPGNPLALAEAIDLLLTNRKQAEGFSRNARRRAAEYSIQTVAAHYQKLYLSLARRG